MTPASMLWVQKGAVPMSRGWSQSRRELSFPVQPTSERNRYESPGPKSPCTIGIAPGGREEGEKVQVEYMDFKNLK